MSTQTAAADEMPAQQPAANQEQPPEFVLRLGDIPQISTQTAAADEMPAQQPATNQEQPPEFVLRLGDIPQISTGKEEQLSWEDFISGATVGPEQPDTWDWAAPFSVPEPEPETVNQEQPEQQPTDEQAFGRVVAETAALAALESLTVEKKHVDGGEQWLNDKGEVIAEVSTGG
uniref:hypothetical protein n=1 Tax=Streptomyces chartreusis TaxID=1969 RepID=UPI003F49748F